MNRIQNHELRIDLNQPILASVQEPYSLSHLTLPITIRDFIISLHPSVTVG